MNAEAVRQYVEKMYPRQYFSVVDGGKLIGDWGNVAEHCCIQVVAVETLADLLGLPKHDKIALAEVAACHDWSKRLEKRPGDFTDVEVARAYRLFSYAAPDKALIAALGPSFLLRAVSGQATFLEMIQFLVDDMALGGKIVSSDERIDEVSARNPSPSPEVEEKLGRPYWDVEREMAQLAEAVVYSIFMMRRIPGDIAGAINAQLEKRFPG